MGAHSSCVKNIKTLRYRNLFRILLRFFLLLHFHSSPLFLLY